MEISISKQSVLSPPECVSDPEEQEISEEDDDDRNHKHRRRETRSQSLERDSSDQVFARSYRKNNGHFDNGNAFTEHERWRSCASSTQRVHCDLNQRIRPFSGDSGPGRGRGRDYGSWNQRDSRVNSVDLSSHMVQVGSIAPSMFGGRGLAGLPSRQNAPWHAFRMLPGIPNSRLEALHTIGLQGTLRPALNCPLNVGIPLQRCRDFEERGFCLRGDMCPMEHGINRIVVDDVQSLSQFNLPVSLPSAPLLTAPSKSHDGSASTFSAKGVNGKYKKGGKTGDGLGYDDAYAGAVGTEFYDPDQPLWNNNTGETSGALSGINSHGIDETVSMWGGRAENESGMRNLRSTSQTSLGRICGSNTGANAKEKVDRALSLSGDLRDEVKEASIGSSRQGKRPGETSAKLIDSSSNATNDVTHNIRKPTQKALQTIFVNGIPSESNKRELLLSHFQKFGKVIDIRIPLNSERAFVQFSKREEAEAALRAPDAVMGNRFIKLWWANRDSIPDIGPSTGNSGSMSGRFITGAGRQYQFSIATTSKGHLVSAPPEGPVLQSAEAPPSSVRPKLVATNGPKVPSPQCGQGLNHLSKEELERLRKEVQRKQATLEQKRIEFYKEFESLNKRVPQSNVGGSKSSQASIVKVEEANEPAAKRLKVDTAADLSGTHPNSSSDPATATASSKPESLTEKSKVAQKSISIPKPKRSTEVSLQESKNLKQRIRPFATTMKTPMANRYKLDNRTTTIRVVPPLPTGLADAVVLKEHFSSYGEVSNVELEGEGRHDIAKDSDASENRGAHVTYAKRGAAEKAFANAKNWQGNVLQFVWVERGRENSNNNPSEEPSAPDAPVSSVKESSTEAMDGQPDTEERCLREIRKQSEE